VNKVIHVNIGALVEWLYVQTVLVEYLFEQDEWVHLFGIVEERDGLHVAQVLKELGIYGLELVVAQIQLFEVNEMIEYVRVDRFYLIVGQRKLFQILQLFENVLVQGVNATVELALIGQVDLFHLNQFCLIRKEDVQRFSGQTPTLLIRKQC
jgi:hypothetical protein